MVVTNELTHAKTNGSSLGQAERLSDKTSEFIEFARTHSPFYRKLYSSLPRGPLQLSELPVINPIDFWRSNPSAGNELCTSPHADGVVFASGGSTGSPKTSLVSKSELKAVSQYVSSCLVSAGVWPGDRVANFFVAGDLYSSFFVTSLGVVECPVSSARVAPDREADGFRSL